MMKKLLSAIVLAALCCGMFSCNEKPPQNYKIVKVLNDGKEEVEELVAPNDTVALNMYLDKLGKIIVENMDKEEAPFKKMFILSPKGDTLNTNEELLNEVMKTSNPVPAPAASAEPVALKPVGDAKQEPSKLQQSHNKQTTISKKPCTGCGAGFLAFIGNRVVALAWRPHVESIIPRSWEPLRLREPRLRERLLSCGCDGSTSWQRPSPDPWPQA